MQAFFYLGKEQPLPSFDPGQGRSIGQQKMRLTAKDMVGRRYDFELPSPEEEARASSLGEGDEAEKGQGPSALDLEIEAPERGLGGSRTSRLSTYINRFQTASR